MSHKGEKQDQDQEEIYRTRAYSSNVFHVLKRWATWSPGTRWLVGGLAAVLLALAIAWTLFLPAADWLARHDVGSVTGPPLQAARDAARGRLLTLGAGLFAAGALAYTARNFTLSRRIFELTEQGQVTERYTKAIEQLGSDKLDVRIGGIYALERIAHDSARDHPTVMEVLCAFIRAHSHEDPQRPEDGSGQPIPDIRPDVEAGLTVIGRRNTTHDRRSIDLSRAKLTDATLRNANLTDANLFIVNLTEADLIGAWLTGAELTGANLTGARLERAHLVGAGLWDADLSGADLRNADLTRANLTDARLTDANLTDANLTDANLANADLTGANLAGTKWSNSSPVPEGWARAPDSDRLSRTKTDDNAG